MCALPLELFGIYYLNDFHKVTVVMKVVIRLTFFVFEFLLARNVLAMDYIAKLTTENKDSHISTAKGGNVSTLSNVTFAQGHSTVVGSSFVDLTCNRFDSRFKPD